MNKTTDTAILVFTRTAAKEAICKNYVPHAGVSVNISIARKLIAHTVAQAEKAGVDVYCFDSSVQYGNSFGERLTNAIEDVFKRNYQSVIITSSDTPNITTEHFQKALSLMERNSLVIGPSIDGGVYMIGINKNCYSRKQFLNISWHTSSVKHNLVVYAKYLGVQSTETELLIDLDTHTDLIRWLSSASNSLVFFVKKLLSFIRNNYKRLDSSFIFDIVLGYIPQRGPPVTAG